MKDIILFVSVFVIVYLVYFIFVVNRKKSLNKLQDGKELIYLKKCYKLNYSKINIKSIANAIALGNAFVISFVVTIISFFKPFLLQMIIGLILLLPTILLVYHIIGKIYQNKQRRRKI